MNAFLPTTHVGTERHVPTVTARTRVTVVLVQVDGIVMRCFCPLSSPVHMEWDGMRSYGLLVRDACMLVRDACLFHEREGQGIILFSIKHG